MNHDHDVVVVGGGLSGLSAGQTLSSTGCDAVVLEARDRVGGKTHSLHTDHEDTVEYGGQWVGADQNRVLSLIDKYDIETRPQYNEGALVTRLGGQRYVTDTYKQAFAALPEQSTKEVTDAFEEIARCVEQVPRDAPQEAPHADKWDAMTLRTWGDRWFDTPAAQATFERMIPGIYTADPADISFLFFCYYARTAGGFDMVAGLNEEQDSHESVVVDVQSIATSLAADLGDRVRLNSPVGRIVTSEEGVTVETPTDSVTAKYVVVALPPSLAGRIEYEPALPAGRDELTQRMPNGAVIKCLLRYDRPFWRESGYSGFAEDDRGPANYYFDDGQPESETGRLVGFICGNAARKWAAHSSDARRDALTAQLAALFEDERLKTPIDYLDRAWNSERYSRGAYHGYPTPGTMTTCWDAIRQPVGRIHWASAEAATKWYGHMDGAIRSGERAADEILERLA